ncbi:uncharacterized protein LOC120339032 isoform X1 [Styela clava]
MEIPLVDFSGCGLEVDLVSKEMMESVGNEIYKAFSEVGFVYLVQCGVPSELVDDVMKVSNHFFLMSSDAKRKYKFDENYSGYHEFLKEGTNPQRPKDIKESYQVGGMALDSGQISWPDVEVPGFSTNLMKLFEECKKLSMRILEVLATGMKIKDKEYFLQCHSRIGKERNYTTLRSLYYPSVPENADVKSNQIRLGEHSDFGTMTLLFQDDIGGLEVETYDGEYIEAKPIPGTVLVNIGDLLQFWTNGRLKSTKHRIMIPTEESKRKRHRQSLAYFVHPNYEVKLNEIEYEAPGLQCRNYSKNFTSDYDRNVTTVEYTEARYKNTYR